MNEFIKAISVIVFLFATIPAVLFWSVDHPNPREIQGRIWCTSLSVLSLGVAVVFILRKDRAPDYLKQYDSFYRQQNGLAFSLQGVQSVDTGDFLMVLFQNQYAQPCDFRFAARPSRRSPAQKANMPIIRSQMACPGGAFGVARIPMAIPAKCAGERIHLEIGATVRYPHGKGKQLRFQHHGSIGLNDKFTNRLQTALTILGALGGSLIWQTPERFEFTAPESLAPPQEQPAKTHLKVLWQYGDEPLEHDELKLTSSGHPNRE